jgi:hypothetical protein
MEEGMKEGERSVMNENQHVHVHLLRVSPSFIPPSIDLVLLKSGSVRFSANFAALRTELMVRFRHKAEL